MKKRNLDSEDLDLSGDLEEQENTVAQQKRRIRIPQFVDSESESSNSPPPVQKSHKKRKTKPKKYDSDEEDYDQQNYYSGVQVPDLHEQLSDQDDYDEDEQSRRRKSRSISGSHRSKSRSISSHSHSSHRKRSVHIPSDHENEENQQDEENDHDQQDEENDQDQQNDDDFTTSQLEKKPNLLKMEVLSSSEGDIEVPGLHENLSENNDENDQVGNEPPPRPKARSKVSSARGKARSVSGQSSASRKKNSLKTIMNSSSDEEEVTFTHPSNKRDYAESVVPPKKRFVRFDIDAQSARSEYRHPARSVAGSKASTKSQIAKRAQVPYLDQQLVKLEAAVSEISQEDIDSFVDDLQMDDNMSDTASHYSTASNNPIFGQNAKTVAEKQYSKMLLKKFPNLVKKKMAAQRLHNKCMTAGVHEVQHWSRERIIEENHKLTKLIHSYNEQLKKEQQAQKTLQALIEAEKNK